MAKKQPTVAAYLAQLAHPRKDEIERVRAIVLGAAPGLDERVKWNAPSFGYGGEDRITFRLQPGDRVQLVFHRGATATEDAAFTFADGSGLLQWVAADRAVVTFDGMSDVEAKAPALGDLVRRWLQATSAPAHAH